MKWQSQTVLARKKIIIYQVLQNLISEAPQMQRKMAWYMSFTNKARTGTLLLTKLTHSFSWLRILVWDSPRWSHHPRPWRMRDSFFQTVQKGQGTSGSFSKNIFSENWRFSAPFMGHHQKEVTSTNAIQDYFISASPPCTDKPIDTAA